MSNTFAASLAQEFWRWRKFRSQIYREVSYKIPSEIQDATVKSSAFGLA